jgi:hypothetical protein
MESPHYPNEDEGPRILGATLTVTIVALSTLFVRLYVRIKKLDAVGCDVRLDLCSFGNCC